MWSADENKTPEPRDIALEAFEAYEAARIGEVKSIIIARLDAHAVRFGTPFHDWMPEDLLDEVQDEIGEFAESAEVLSIIVQTLGLAA